MNKDEEVLKNFEFTKDTFTKWEDDMSLVNEVKKYGKMLSYLWRRSRAKIAHAPWCVLRRDDLLVSSSEP